VARKIWRFEGLFCILWLPQMEAAVEAASAVQRYLPRSTFRFIQRAKSKQGSVQHVWSKEQ